jgi:hypothetical protein
VTIKPYGVKSDVLRAINAIQAIFNTDTVLVYPSGARFIRVWAVTASKLVEDPGTKTGLDIWACEISAVVWSIRVLDPGAPAVVASASAPPASSSGGYEHE